MSTREAKRLRRADAPAAKALDRKKRAEMRVPWWVRAAAWLFGEGVRVRWVQRWQQEHERKMKRARKRTARFRKAYQEAGGRNG